MEENITPMWMDYETFKAIKPLEHLGLPLVDVEHSYYWADYSDFPFNQLIKLTPKIDRIYVLNYGEYRRLVVTTYLNLNEYEAEHLRNEIEENLEFVLHGEGF